MTTQKTARMLCIGTATQDVFLVNKKLFIPHQDEQGEFLRLPLGGKLDLEKVVLTTGGNASNAAVTFARQGLESVFMGVLGTEPTGEAILRELDNEDVDTRYVHQDERYNTGYSTVVLASTGSRTILRSHGGKLHPDDLDLEAITHADWLYVSSVGSMELLEKVITEGTRRNTKIAYNPSSAELQHPDKIRTLLEDIDVLIANKEEMALLVEGDNSEELARHALHFVDIAIVSDGPHGAVAADHNKIVKAGMYEDVPVVDRLGAGDAFGSGFTAMLAKSKTLEEAVVFASANSTSVVSYIGAKKGILYHDTQLHDMPLETTLM